MAERDNKKLNQHIKDVIREWKGTAFGETLKNMWDNGTSYDGMLDYMGEDIEFWEDEE